MATKKDIQPTAVEVSSRPESFRRAGRTFTREPQVIALSDLKKGELEALQAEPQLVVQQTVVEPVAEEGQ